MGTAGNGFSGDVHCLAWANVRFGSSADRRVSAESRTADGVVPSQAATFRVRANSKLRAVTAEYGIAFSGDYWGIASIAEVGRMGSEFEFTAVRIGP